MGRGSSGIGSAGAKRVSKALKSIEDRIRRNSTESAVVIDSNGNVLFDTSDGHETSVQLSVEQMRIAHGQILTHNHPHGYFLSDADIGAATTLGLKQLRATTPDGRAFVLERTESTPADNSLYHAYRIAIKSTAGNVVAKVYDPKLTTRELSHKASLEHTKILNKWLEENAPRFGWAFREEKSK